MDDIYIYIHFEVKTTYTLHEIKLKEQTLVLRNWSGSEAKEDE